MQLAMKMPKCSRNKYRSDKAADIPSIVIDIATHRVLRRILGLSQEDITQIDLHLAVEAGLLKRPSSQMALTADDR
jgi:hypothetical protein